MSWVKIPEHDQLKSSVKKIRNADIPCNHPEHRPPMHMVFEPGVYVNTCPACGKKTVFRGHSISH